MFSNLKHLLILLSLVLVADILHAQKLITFPEIPGRTPSDKYVCRVRQVGTEEWKSAFVVQTTCKNNPKDNVPAGTDNGYFKILDGWSASFISFEFSGTSVEVEIAKVGGAPITKAMVRPVGHASAATIVNGKAYIVFDKPANVNVDIDGQMEDNYTGMDYAGPRIHTISLFGNPVYKEPGTTNPRVISLNPGETIPQGTSSAWDTIYFKPGVHNIGSPYTIYSDKVLYIPGNAIVHGTIHPKNAWGNDASKNWSVYGSGAISGENNVWTGDENKNVKTFTYQAEAARLEGFVVMDPANHTFNMNQTGPNEKVNIYKNVKVFGWRKNSDGINAFRNSVITDCFFRCQDDVFYYGGDNVKISNCVTWNDANGAVVYVTKGATSMDMSYFKDIKVIYHRAFWHYWEGGRVVSFRDRKPGNTIKNVQIRNVLIEDPKSAFPPFYMKMSNPDNSSATVNFDNIIIENVRQEFPVVTLPGREPTRNTMLGLDDARKFKNITFKNCYYNKKWLGSFHDGDFLVNKYVENISFILDSVKHQVKLTVNNEGWGTVTGDGIYTHGNKATITATPANDKIFSGWMIGSNIVSVSQQYTFVVDKDLEIKAIFSPPTGTGQNLNNKFKIYPNPATGELFYNAAGESVTKIEMVDLTGKVVFANNFPHQNGSIDLTDFISGLYLFRIYTNNELLISKVKIN